MIEAKPRWLVVKIPCFYLHGSFEDGIYAAAFVHLKHKIGPVHFLIDTGCPITFIGAEDSAKLQIKTSKPSSVKIYAGMQELKIVDIGAAALKFRFLDGGTEKLHSLESKNLRATGTPLGKKACRNPRAYWEWIFLPNTG